MEFVIGGAFEKGLDESGGALGSGLAFALAGVLKLHGGGDIEDEEKVPTFLGLDGFNRGSMGLGFDEEKSGECPGEAAEREDAQDGCEDGGGGEPAIGTEGEVADFPDPTGVEEFGAGGEDGGGGGDEDGDEHYQGA